MYKILCLLVVAVAMSFSAGEADAQHFGRSGFGFNSFNRGFGGFGGSGFSIGVNRGFGGGFPVYSRPVYRGGGFSRGGFSRGFGGGCGY